MGSKAIRGCREEGPVMDAREKPPRKVIGGGGAPDAVGTANTKRGMAVSVGMAASPTTLGQGHQRLPCGGVEGACSQPMIAVLCSAEEREVPKENKRRRKKYVAPPPPCLSRRPPCGVRPPMVRGGAGRSDRV